MHNKKINDERLSLLLKIRIQFYNLKEALGEGTKYIYAVETDLSADPLMVRGISELI